LLLKHLKKIKNMARTKLSAEQMKNLRELVKQGVRPQTIAEQFKIAVSSVHNYKNSFREQGFEIPDSPMGRRPVDLMSSDDSRSYIHDFKKEPVVFTVGTVRITVEGSFKSVDLLSDRLVVLL
jgi:transposase